MDAPLLNRSLWLEAEGEGFAPLPGDVETDVAVVGAGITGVTTALLLKQEGLRVVLLESSRVAHGATGYTTAKLTVGHGTVYRKLVEAHGTEVARAYASSNAAALERVASIVEEHAVDCDFERASNYVYTEDADRVGAGHTDPAGKRGAEPLLVPRPHNAHRPPDRSRQRARSGSVSPFGLPFPRTAS